MKHPNPIPPRLATRLLLLFLREDLAEEVTGDLLEKFQVTVKERSFWRARVSYWFEVLHYFRPFAIRRARSLRIHSLAMISNYLVISRRMVVKQKLYAFINVSGLSAGLACFLMIMLYIQHEFSYNRFYANADRLYRVYQKQEGNAFMGTDFFSVTPAKLAAVMRDELPEVEHATSVEHSLGMLSFGDEHYFEEGLAGDASFFRVFPMTFIDGDLKTALGDPNAIVLTESLAKKIFGDKEAVGQLIRYHERDGFKVSGVITDPPPSSSLRYTFIVNIHYNDYWKAEMEKTAWSGNSFYTFFALVPGADPKILEQKFPALIQKYRDPEGYKNYPFRDTYYVQPVSEMYFQTGINFDIGLKGNKKMVYVFLTAAVIILLLACVNYMNLAIARSVKRSREVGVRKIAGALKNQIVLQFLTESILIALASLLVAGFVTYLLLPSFGAIMERPLAFDIMSNRYLLPGLTLLVMIVGVLSGSYPAFVMSGLRPVEVLKNKGGIMLPGFSLQRALIVLQFTVSISLIILSLVIHRQLDYMRNKELGYDKHNVVTIRLRDYSLREKFPVLREEWLQRTQVASAALTTHLPTNITSSTIVTRTASATTMEGLAIYQWIVSESFTDVFGMQLVAGRVFSADNQADTEACILNETAARALGWSPHEAVGKEFYNDGKPVTVIGVLADFHMHSMHLPIEPLMTRQAQNRGSVISVRINGDDVPATLAFLESTVKKISSYPFQFEFLEDNYDNLYKSEDRLGEIFDSFTVVSVLIASLGLFGLAAFLCEQRTKEIGIRKILGASMYQLVYVLSRDIVLLVIISIIVAIPLSWYSAGLWLQDFAYRIDIGWGIFAIAGAAALLMAKLSIGYQSIKTSSANPADTLRTE